MCDGFSIVGVGSAVGIHALKELNPLLIRHLGQISGLWPIVADRQKEHATVPGVADEAVW